jgi:tRNA nucleotidyltransferase (CCA-adding enzyme)
MEFFEVGGCVRDEIMGHPSKDIDFSVVAPSFEAMRQAVVDAGMKIVVESPEFFTVRAVAKTPFQGRSGGLDFVWARKEGPYSDGRHPDFVEPGTLEDDLSRRDFTMNAIAKAADGSLIDPFNGVTDIRNRKIRCVGAAEDRLREDALRGLRALRFSVTKGMVIDRAIRDTMRQPWFAEALSSVSKERQREEMEKMFAHDTLGALRQIDAFGPVARVIFSNGLRLSATMAK